MHYEPTKVSATYEVRSEADRLNMDATAKGVAASYGAKSLGCYDTLGNFTRTHEYELSYNRAIRAVQDFLDLGFQAEMRLV